MINENLFPEQITGYEFDINHYHQSWYKQYIFLILSFIIIPVGNVYTWIVFIIGYILFIKRLKTKRNLNKIKKELLNNLQSNKDTLSVEEYFNYLKRIKLVD
ncbi:MAG: hypothetical protein WCL51_12165 [Bacteroidota bacterium]